MKTVMVMAAAAWMAHAAAGQTLGVSASERFAFGENIGWTNWRPTPAGGVRFHGTFASGLVWGENVGWINLGDGTPVSGVAYANASGLDFGVNVDPATGRLSGLAWGENIGWVNFGGGALATPANPARLDAGSNRLRGYVWGENVGWINLDHGTHFVGLRCPGDWDDDGAVDFNDLLAFLNDFNGQSPLADLNEDGVVDFNDLLAFLNLYNAGC